MITKICGIKNIETLICCEKNRVDFFGMIFFKASPRNILIDQAKKLQNKAKKLQINGVGVFVNEKISNLKQYINDLNLKFIQLHGDENNEYIKEIKKQKVIVIKKISIKIKENLDDVRYYSDADYFLFDYKPEKNELPGGNAKSFDWSFVKGVNIKKPWFLSGGVNFDNIHYIKRNINPFGVDLSSGVEKELGIKDNQIINNFMDKLNNA